MDKKSAKKSDSSEKESDDADRSSDPTQEEEATDSQSEESDSPAGNVRKAGGSGAVQASAVGGTPSGQKAQSHSSGEGYVNYERGSDPGALSARYGMDVRDAEAGELQRLEREFGRNRVSRWVEEGMTVETMGKPRNMQAFRKRQTGHSQEIPTDIEQRNQASRHRNTARTREDGPAGDTGVPDVVRRVVSSPGRSMDETIQREMESKIGEDFSDVQVHTGPMAAAAAETINARAFTVRNHVVFKRGEYQPDSDRGKKVLAHELTHVRQQTDGTVSMLTETTGDDQGADASSRPADRTILHRGTEMHVQPKLELNSPDDPAEKEAEAVAERVVEMEGAEEQQPSGEEGRRGTDDAVTPSESAGASGGGPLSDDAESSVRSGVRGSGTPLASKTQTEFESKMGADFSDVTVHTDTAADAAAKSINAEAYTVGSDIAFASGNYNPDSKAGKRLLAHELTHVSQQTGGATRTIHRNNGDDGKQSGDGDTGSGGSDGQGGGDGGEDVPRDRELTIKNKTERILELYVKRELDIENLEEVRSDLQIGKAQNTMKTDSDSRYYIYDKYSDNVTPVSDIVDVELIGRETVTNEGQSIIDDPEGHTFDEYVRAAKKKGNENRQDMHDAVTTGFAQVKRDVEFDILNSRKKVRKKLDEKLQKKVEPFNFVEAMSDMADILGFSHGRKVIEFLDALKKANDALKTSPGLAWDDLFKKGVLLIINGQALAVQYELSDNQSYFKIMKNASHYVFSQHAALTNGQVDLAQFQYSPEEFAGQVQQTVWSDDLLPEDSNMQGRIDGQRAVDYYNNLFQAKYKKHKYADFSSAEECVQHHQGKEPPTDKYPQYDFSNVRSSGSASDGSG